MNEITSAVYHRLENTDLTNISTVSLYSDGCGVQNKNQSMVGMLSKWLLTQAPENVKQIQLIFPVVGHSFIPPDRVFGSVEQQFKKRSILSNPESYLKLLFEEHVTEIYLYKIGRNFQTILRN